MLYKQAFALGSLGSVIYRVRASTVRTPRHSVPKNSLLSSQVSPLQYVKHQTEENDFKITLIPLTPETTLNGQIHKLLVLNTKLENKAIQQSLYLCQ